MRKFRRRMRRRDSIEPLKAIGKCYSSHYYIHNIGFTVKTTIKALCIYIRKNQTLTVFVSHRFYLCLSAMTLREILADFDINRNLDWNQKFSIQSTYFWQIAKNNRNVGRGRQRLKDSLYHATVLSIRYVNSFNSEFASKKESCCNTAF